MGGIDATCGATLKSFREVIRLMESKAGLKDKHPIIIPCSPRWDFRTSVLYAIQSKAGL